MVVRLTSFVATVLLIALPAIDAAPITKTYIHGIAFSALKLQSLYSFLNFLKKIIRFDFFVLICAALFSSIHLILFFYPPSTYASQLILIFGIAVMSLFNCCYVFLL